MTLKFCFYIPSVICINYFSVVVRTNMTKTNKQKQTNKQETATTTKNQNQKGKNSTKKRKICFSLMFQKASVQHSEESMFCWQELETMLLDLLCTLETWTENTQEMSQTINPQNSPLMRYILNVLSYR